MIMILKLLYNQLKIKGSDDNDQEIKIKIQISFSILLHHNFAAKHLVL